LRIGHPRLLAALAVAALGAGVAACGDEEPPPDEAGSDFAAEVEAIMSEQVDPAGIAASDAVINVAQGNPDVEGEVEEVIAAAEDLAAAEDAVSALDPPEDAAVATEELAARIGVLADRFGDATPAEIERDPNVYAENIGTDLDRIENRANQAIEAAEGSAS
jgi:hypothetical protein